MGKRTQRTADKHQRLVDRIREQEDRDVQATRLATRIEPKTANQQVYLESMMANDMTFGFGPAGTGKTFLAGVMAAQYYQEGAIEKIVICRPAVEANGEKLGFLPGNLNEKMDPYLRPIFDAFQRFWHPKQVKAMMEHGQIEISPLAYMRGRTFHDCFVIADEMQNANAEMMLMLITRLGENSRMVITGDPDQRDLRGATGYEHAREKLSSVPGVGFVHFGTEDVVRHPLVQKILRAW